MRVSGTSGCGQKIAKSMFSPRMPPMFSTPHVMRTRTHIGLGYREIGGIGGPLCERRS